MTRALFDSNVPVSAFLVAQGPSARLIRRWEAGQFELWLSDAILDEVREVLRRPRIRDRYRLTDEEIDRYVAALADTARNVEVADAPHVVLADPKDDHVLEAARVAGAHVIVTGDSRLLALRDYLAIPIMTPARFLADLLQRPNPDEDAGAGARRTP